MRREVGRDPAGQFDYDRPAPTRRTSGEGLPDWAFERPATGESMMARSFRVTVPEAAILQSFSPDYPFTGTRTAQFRQVGDAVPPLLARAVLLAAEGRS